MVAVKRLRPTIHYNGNIRGAGCAVDAINGWDGRVVVFHNIFSFVVGVWLIIHLMKRGVKPRFHFVPRGKNHDMSNIDLPCQVKAWLIHNSSRI